MTNQGRNTSFKKSSSLEKSSIDFRKIDFNHLLGDSFPHLVRHNDFNSLEEGAEKFTKDAAESFMRGKEEVNTLSFYYEAALVHIQNGQYEEASQLMQKAVFIDLESRLPGLVIKSCDFWTHRLKKMSFLSLLEKAEYVYEAWASFHQNIVRSDSITLDRVIYAIRMQVFGLLIDQLKECVEVEHDVSYALALARAYKYRGDYDEAIDVYTLILETEVKHSAVLAELADCYAIIDEEVRAKILFREAFFHNVEDIVFTNLESVMIKQLYQKISDLQLFEEVYFLDWMAVYGVVYGVFNYSRELSKSEYTRLNHSIHALRSQIEEHPEKSYLLKPKLIYRLFWLIDYFLANQVDVVVTKENIEKVLFEIKFLDERVYKKYKL